MTTILKNTTITDTGYFAFAKGNTAQRPFTTTNIIQWTNTGTQAYSVLTGNTPTLSNTSWTCPSGVNAIDVLVVAGGGSGSGGNGGSGGGGAGGLIYRSGYNVTPGSTYTVTVGAGGARTAASFNIIGNNGSNSVFDSLTAIGGGAGNGWSNNAGNSGGSGGGGSGLTGRGGYGTLGQGHNGGAGGNQTSPYSGGGGGGAGGPGSDGPGNSLGVASGGPGLCFHISGTPTWYAGGGGAGTEQNTAIVLSTGLGGIGGGGRGGFTSTQGTDATPSTGGGGGGGGYSAGNSPIGGAGGSGIVIIRYYTLSDATDPSGLVRYNTNLKGIEIYDGVTTGWTSQDPTKNFATHNMLKYSEDFTNSVWTPNALSVLSNVAVAPDGTLTADALVEDSSVGNSRYLLQDIPLCASATVTQSIYAKAAGRNFFQFSPSTGFSTSDHWVTYQLTGSGTYSIGGTNALGATATIASVGNGWYRCTITTPTQATTTGRIALSPASSISDSRLSSYQGNGSASVYIWGIQFEVGTAATQYSATTTNNSGFASVKNIGNYRVHTYTNILTSSFTADCTGNVEVLVVAGGGGGGGDQGGGGGGAGGLIYNTAYPVVAGTSYTVTVGAGGTGDGTREGHASSGNNSQFGNLTAIGGGGGPSMGVNTNPARPGRHGGSGSGATMWQTSGTYNGGPGVTNQGNRGGNSFQTGNGHSGGGGGGAGAPGTDGGAGLSNTGGNGGHGGAGLQIAISGAPTWYAGGGGGGCYYAIAGNGGDGGGGKGTSNTSSAGNPGQGATGVDGAANTGGGGGGAGGTGGNGGSGIVIVRYKNF